jgi:hypothetical protein
MPDPSEHAKRLVFEFAQACLEDDADGYCSLAPVGELCDYISTLEAALKELVNFGPDPENPDEDSSIVGIGVCEYTPEQLRADYPATAAAVKAMQSQGGPIE